MRKILAAFLAIMIFTESVSAQIDETIFKDPVVNTFYGRDDGANLIENLKFKDINGHWAKETIIQTGALNLVKGYGDYFEPNGTVSNQEALAFVVRALGMEKAAHDAAVTLRAQAPQNADLLTNWSIGYLEIARQIGLLTDQQFLEAISPDPALQDPAVSYVRTAPVTRENVADYIFRGLSTMNPAAFVNNNTVQGILKFNDFKDIAVDKAAAVEALASAKIMNGDTSSNFRPKGKITRAEMAQVLRNMDSIYFNSMGIVRLNGTVSGIKDVQLSQSGNYNLERNIYLRMMDGSVNIIKYQTQKNSSPQAINKDVPVFKDNDVNSLGYLRENDKIEFLLESATGRILYVKADEIPAYDTFFTGKLTALDFANANITLVADNNKTFIFYLSKGLLDTQNNINYIFIGQEKHDIKKLPMGSKFELTLRNNIVRELKFIGQDVLINEERGIVTENNHEFGYITYINNDGIERTMNYNSSDLKVEKQNHYDLEDEIGYYDEVFPDFRYDPRDSVISEIEPGDIVFIRPYKDDPETIESISAATNYIMKTGKVLKYVDNDDYYSMLVEYDDKQTTWFDLAKEIFVSQDGKNKSTEDINIGDYVKILVNQAIISPGYIMETAKEIVIEGDEHFISSIIKGQLAGINAIQNKIQIQNSQILTQNGWSNYNQLNQLSLLDKDIEFYHNSKRISADYALKYLKRADGDVYIAMQNNYTGEKVKKVTFRDGRDTLLAGDTVIATNEEGGFRILSVNEFITTDDGTIVVKEGRLITGSDIAANDFALTSINDGNNAAVVNITKIAENIKSMFVRARVNSVDEGKSFRVQSIAVLNEMDWSYSPIQRDYAIDYNTLFINKDGFVPLEKFMDFTGDSVVDKVFNVIVDGSKATHIIDSPYAKTGVRGIIYGIENNNLKIKDATYYDAKTGKWTPISNKDSTAVITIPLNSAIAKNNKVIYAKDLQVGNQIKVLTDNLPEKIGGGMNVTGYIVLVEK